MATKTKVYEAEVVYLAPQTCAECKDRARKSASVCHDSFNCSLFDGAAEVVRKITAADLGFAEEWEEIEFLA